MTNFYDKYNVSTINITFLRYIYRFYDKYKYIYIFLEADEDT